MRSPLKTENGVTLGLLQNRRPPPEDRGTVTKVVTEQQWRRQNVSAAGAQPGHQNLDWGSGALSLKKMRSLLSYL